MSIDKDEEGGSSPPSFVSRNRIGRTLWMITVGPVIILPFLLLGAVVWGVVLRVLVELFNYAYNLFNF
jgi:hypothetical protein